MKQERRPSARSYGEQFVVMFPDVLMELAKDRTAPKATFPVFVWCVKHLSFEKWKLLRQEDAAQFLEVSRPAVSQSLKALLERGFLERRGSGPRQEWRIAPEAAWMGTADSFHKARRERGYNPPGLKVVE